MSSLLPQGWSISTLSSLSKVITKGTTPTTNGFPYTKSGVKFLRVENISKGGKILENDLKFISEEANNSLSRSQLKEGDLLISIAGAIGRSAIVEKKHLPANTNQAVGIVRLLDGFVENNYIRFSFESPIVDKQITDLQSGLAQINLNLEQLGSLRINLPPLIEQQKIAAILTSVDEVIESTQAQINKLKDLKTGMMQELLTKGIGHTEFKDSAVGQIPVSWVCLQMHKIAKVTDGAHFTPTYTEEGVPFLRVTDLKNRSIFDGQIKHIPRHEHEELIKRCKPEKGDILFSKNGTIGLTRLIDWDDEFSIFVSLALIKILTNKVTSEYLALFMESPIVKEQIIKRSKQGSVTNLHLEEIREFDIPLPNIKEQKQIVKVLTSLIQKIEVTEKRLELLQNTKKALMQDLLTGKVRVKVA